MFSTFLGAGLAFLMVRMHDARQRYLKNVSAGNLALFAIRTQLNEFLLFRRNFYVDVCDTKSHPEGTPLYLLVRPSFQTYVGQAIDFDSLAFLFSRTENASVFNDLHLSQTCYEDLVEIHEFRNRHAVEIQRRLDQMSRENRPTTIEAIEGTLGPYLIATMSMVAVGLAKRARDDEAVYRNTFASLRGALEIEFGRWWRIRPPSLVRLEDADPKFKQESLPRLPERLLSALEDLHKTA